MEPVPFEIPPSNGMTFVFPSAYGGAVQSPMVPQIHSLVGKLRRAVGAVAAKQSTEKWGPKFPVRGAKDLNQKLADALNSLDMVTSVVAQEIHHIDAGTIPKNERDSGSPVFRTLVHCKSTVRIIAPDTSFIDVVGSGHGGDVDDKSGGKASTYAWKDAILKGLTIPHEDMVDTDDASTAEGEGPGSREMAPKGVRKGSKAKRESGDSSAVPVVGDSSAVPVVEVGEADVAAGESEGEGSAGLGYVVAQITKAVTVADLESIKEQIKTGVLSLTPSEKLIASKSYMEKMKKLRDEAKEVNGAS